MKKPYKLFLNSLLICLLVVLTNMAHAQTPAGPSDNTTAPPTSSASVAKVYCAGSTITLTGPTGYSTYQWYKVNSSGTAVLALTTTSATTPYTETTASTAAAAGYYNYQLVVINSNGCSSPASTISVYVVPPLSVTITTTATAVCSNVSPTPVLTANPTPATPYTLNYQWTLGGSNIVGATSATYTVPVTSTTTVLTLTYGVNVTYALNTTCGPATATQTITVNPLPTLPTITAS